MGIKRNVRFWIFILTIFAILEPLVIIIAVKQSEGGTLIAVNKPLPSIVNLPTDTNTPVKQPEPSAQTPSSTGKSPSAPTNPGTTLTPSITPFFTEPAPKPPKSSRKTRTS